MPGFNMMYYHEGNGVDDTTSAQWITASLARLDKTNTPPWTDATSERTETMSTTDQSHEHRYSGQTLRHSHDGGNTPHGYFQHAEDFPQETPGPDETYNGQPFPASSEDR